MDRWGDILTEVGATTMALDSQTKRLWLPTAKFEPLAVEGQRARMRPTPARNRPRGVAGCWARDAGEGHSHWRRDRHGSHSRKDGAH